MTDPLARVDDLERQDRLEDAAALAESLGARQRAADLWERACKFERAAAAALGVGDFVRALALSRRAGAPDLEQRAVTALAADPARARTAARRFRALGNFWEGALLLEAVGDATEAGALFERAGDALRAADAFSRGGETAGAVRVLGALVAREPDHDVARVRLARLLIDDDPEAAARFVQSVDRGSPEYGEAVTVLRAALAALGFDRASAGFEVAPTKPKSKRDVEARENDGAVLFGRYRVVGTSAVGATASVYEAADRVTGRAVAVKVFRASDARGFGRDALERFAREARALSELRHPAIVPLVEYRPEAPAVVLEWMAGGSFADCLRRQPPSPAYAVEVTAAVLAALHEAHRRGILHRDVKPSNVLLDAAGLARLSDFGSAHLADSAATVTEGAIGTIAYMAPEQRAGAPANPSSDVFGAGAVLWEALTGAPPGGAEGFLSPDLDERHRAVARALIARENERPATAQEALAFLRSLSWPSRIPPDAAPSARETAGAVHSAPPETNDVRFAPERLTQQIARVDRAFRTDPFHDRPSRALGPGVEHDAWLARRVRVVVASEEALRTARAFAMAAHPSLATIYALDETRGVVYVEAESVIASPTCDDRDRPRGANGSVAEASPNPALIPRGRFGRTLNSSEHRSSVELEALSDEDVRRLDEALRALHRAGATHGAVDAAHLFRRGGAIALAYPSKPGSGTAVSDLAALEALERRC